jgi:hypothetical protein
MKFYCVFTVFLLTGRPLIADQFDVLSSRFSGISQSLHGVAYGNGAFVAVGDNGTILYSTDTITWIPQKSGTTNRLNCIKCGTNGFVAVGDSPPGTPSTILNSPDGITWLQEVSPVTNELSGVSYGFGRFVAVGSHGMILISTNAVDWTSINTGAPYNFNGIDVGNNFVVVGDSGTILTSPDGLAWTFRTSGSFARLLGVSANGTAIAVGESGALLTSPDDVTWTVRTSGTSMDLHAVGFSPDGYGTNQFIAVGARGAFIASPDGSSWTSQLALGTNDLNGVVFAKAGFLVAGNNGAIFSGVLWLNRNSGTTMPLNGVTFGAGKFWGVGGNLSTNIILVSSNGTDWITEYSATNGALLKATFGSSNIVAVGNNGLILTSSGDSSWLVNNVGTKYTLNAATHGNGIFVVVGTYQTNAANQSVTFESTNGVTWAGPFGPLPSSTGISDITFGNNIFVALGASDGSVYNSIDGINWTTQSSGVPGGYNMAAVCSGNGTFVAVGQFIFSSGTQITTSTNGVNWTSQPANNVRTGYFAANAITYGGFGFVAPGSQESNVFGVGPVFVNALTTSPDGKTWIIRAIGGPQIRSMTFGNGSYVGVGDSGTILQSTLTNAQAAPLLGGYSSNGVFNLNAIAEPGYTYRIQFSSNLQDWSDIFTFTSTQAITSFEDTGATNSSLRFYRIKTP